MICGVDVENAAVLYYSIVSNGMKELGLDLKVFKLSIPFGRNFWDVKIETICQFPFIIANISVHP